MTHRPYGYAAVRDTFTASRAPFDLAGTVGVILSPSPCARVVCRLTEGRSCILFLASKWRGVKAVTSPASQQHPPRVSRECCPVRKGAARQELLWDGRELRPGCAGWRTTVPFCEAYMPARCRGLGGCCSSSTAVCIAVAMAGAGDASRRRRSAAHASGHCAAAAGARSALRLNSALPGQHGFELRYAAAGPHARPKQVRQRRLC